MGAASVVRSKYKMEHSGTNNYMEQTNSYMSNEDRLFMSQTMSYPGQGSFTLTVQAGQVTSWRPHNLQPMDSLATAMVNLEVQDENEQLQQPQQHWTVVQQQRTH